MSFLSAVGGFTPIDATGGTTVTTFTDNAGIQYQIHAFENVGADTFTVNDVGDLGTVDVLLVGGGGAGSKHNQNFRQSGGGGAGGVLFEQNVSISTGGFSVTVGDGGAGTASDTFGAPTLGENGDDTEFNGLTALGGGRGGTYYGEALDGGSGGGGAGGVYNVNSYKFGADGLQPTSADGGFGNDGGDGVASNAYDGTDRGQAGGGGGASSAGQNATTSAAGDGGSGYDASSDFGTSFGENGVFGGGGGGSGVEDAGVGGLGGGGDGAEVNSPTADQDSDNISATSGGTNTGGGGGGGMADPSGDGGSGIVLIRYPLEAP